MDRETVKSLRLWLAPLLFCLAGCARNSGPATPSSLGIVPLANVEGPPALADLLRRPERITTTTSDDYLPTLTPDGRAVVYVSDRRGNPDIFLRYLPGSGAVGDYPLTFHTARDTWPAVSPSGEQVAFVSYRSDSKGDLYVLNLRLAEKIPQKIRERIYERFGTLLSKSDAALATSGNLTARITKYLLSQGELVRLTDERAGETEPAWGPRGDRIYFTRDTNGVPNVYSLHLPGKEIAPVTTGGGSMAAPSPDGRWLAFVLPSSGNGLGGSVWILDLRTQETRQMTSGPFDLHPTWSDGSDRVFFSRYAEDTNGDGAITVADNPSIYAVALETKAGSFAVHRITPGSSSDLFPDQQAGKIAIASRESRGGGFSNLSLIPADGFFGAFKRTAELFAVAKELEDGEPAWAALAYDEISFRWPDTPAAAEALYRLGRVADSRLAQPNRSAAAWSLAAKSTERTWAGLSEIQLTRQEIDRTLRRTREVTNLIEKLRTIGDTASPDEMSAVGATAYLEQGRSWKKLGDDASALRAFDHLLARFPREEDLAAQAILEKTALYEKFGDTPKLLANYLDLIRKYPTAEPWASTAAQKMIDLWLSASPTEPLKDAKLREVTATYATTPILPALALNVLGDRAQARNERSVAEESYRSVITQFTAEKRQQARAQLALARLLTDEGDYAAALVLFRQGATVVSKDDPWRKDARRRFVGGLLAKGRSELAGKDFRLAIRTFRDLIAFDYSIAQAHRGMIAAYAALGEVSKVISIYTQERKRLPNHYLPHYALGLAHTYEEPPSSAFDRAEEELLEAISVNGQALFPHQTLGFVFEKREELLKEQDYVERAIDQYLIARALSDPSEDFQNYGDLTLDIGNGYFLLGDYVKSYEAYVTRRSYDLPFEANTQRLVYLERFSRSAFHIERYDEAITLADQALDLLEKMERGRELPPKELLSHRAEISDARALALQSAGRFEEASAGFTKVAELNRKLGQRSNEGKALRNLALNLFDTPRKEGASEDKRLADARDGFQASFEVMEQHGVSTTKGKKIGSLLNINRDVALGDNASEASKGFSKQAERELLYTFITRLERERDRDAEALAALDQKRAALPKETSVNDTQRPALHLNESVVANQRGVLLTRLGRYADANREFLLSFDLAKGLSHEIGMGRDAISLARLFQLAPAVMGREKALEILDLAFERLVQRNDIDAASLASSLALERLHLVEPILPSIPEPTRVSPATLSLAASPLTESLRMLRTAAKRLAGAEPQTPESASLLLELDVAHFRWTGHPTTRFQNPKRDVAAELEARARRLKRDDLVLRIRCANALGQSAVNVKELSGLLEPVLDLLTTRPASAISPALDSVAPLLDRWEEFAVSEGDAEAAYNATEWRSRIALELAQNGLTLERSASASGGDALRAFQDLVHSGAAGPKFDQAFTALENADRGLSSLVRMGIIEAAELQEKLGANRGFVRELETSKGKFRIVVRGNGASLESATTPLANPPRDLYATTTQNCPPNQLCAQVASGAHLFFALSNQSLFDRRAYLFSDQGAIPQPRTPIRWQDRTDLSKHLGLADWFVAPVPLSPSEPASPVSPLRRRFDLPVPDLGRFEREIPAEVLLGSGVSIVFLPPSQPPFHDSDLALLSEWWVRGGVSTVIVTGAETSTKSLFQTPAGTRIGMVARNQGLPVFGALGLTAEERQEMVNSSLEETVTQAAALYRAERWGESVRRFDAALALLDAQSLDSAAGITREQVLDVAGTAAYRADDPDAAIAYTKWLVEIRRKNAGAQGSLDLANALQFLGVLYSRVEKFLPSVASLTEASALYQKLGGSSDKIAENLSTLGIVSENANRFKDAISYFDRSLEIHTQGTGSGMGEQWRRIGRIYYLRLNDYARAEESFRKASDFFAAAKKPLLQDESILEIGLVQERRAAFEKARTLYQQVFTRAQTAKASSLASKAALYTANTYWFEGNYFEAFRWQRTALALAETANDDRMRLLCHSTVGLIYWTLNEYAKALAEQETALELSNKLVSPIDQAAGLNNTGLVYRDRGDLVRSISFFNRALSIDRKLNTAWGMSYDYRNLGISETRLKLFPAALKHFNESIQLSQAIGVRENEAKALQNRGDLYLAQNQIDQAFDSFKQALVLAREIGLREVEWRALGGLARVTLARKNPAGALIYLKEAIDLVETMSAEIKIEEFRNSFVTNKLSLYQDIVLLLLAQGPNYTADAWTYVERARARSFMDLLGNRDVKSVAPQDKALLEKDRQSRRNLSDLENLLAAATDPAARQSVQAQLQTARKAREDLLIEIRASRPELSSFVTVDILRLPEFQKLLGPDTAFVEYFLTDRELLAWVISDTDIHVSRVSVSKKLLEEKLVAYSKAMQEQQPLLRQSEELYRWIFQPVEKWLAGKRFVGISPHETLHYLSYASLFNGTRFVVDAYSLFYSPSASVLKFTLTTKKFDKANARVLAIGNPNLGNPAFDLPFAEKEVGAITRDFPRIEVLTRDKATERWVAANLNNFDVIHLAAHGEFDPINPLFSAIKLAPSAGSAGDLQVEEIFGLRANADLVTLSACQTGLAKIEGGGELIGLNRAFMYAGTHSILSSLWRVSDVSTAILVKHFYRNYLTQTKAESLRQAQLLVKDYYPHPSYWAAFTLTGDYR